jgi:hypothetical protein
VGKNGLLYTKRGGGTASGGAYDKIAISTCDPEDTGSLFGSDYARLVVGEGLGVGDLEIGGLGLVDVDDVYVYGSPDGLRILVMVDTSQSRRETTEGDFGRHKRGVMVGVGCGIQIVCFWDVRLVGG